MNLNEINKIRLETYGELRNQLIALSHLRNQFDNSVDEVLMKVVMDVIDFNVASIIQEEDDDLILEAPSCEMVAQWDVDNNKYYFDCDGE